MNPSFAASGKENDGIRMQSPLWRDTHTALKLHDGDGALRGQPVAVHATPRP